VSKPLRHSEITTTLRTYAHTIKGAGKDAVRKIDEQMARAQNGGVVQQLGGARVNDGYG